MGENASFVNTILIVDDSEMNREILSDMIGDKFHIMEAEDGEQAVAMLQKHSAEISLVLLDLVMPHMNGYEVLEVMNSRHWIESIPVIMISEESKPSNIKLAYEKGVTDFIGRPFDDAIVQRRVMNTIMLYEKQQKLTDLALSQIYEKEKNSNLMIGILSHIVEFRNGESGLHVVHVQNLTEVLLRTLVQITDRYPLSNGDITMISRASALHDIGKISIPSKILNKPGRLTDEEFAIMKTHSMTGAEMLSDLGNSNEPLVHTAYEICRWHHERFDGRGYPDGLKGDEIPISAQIVALADVYDALTSDRVYKKAFPHETAMEMILAGKCGTFNPLLMDCLRMASETVRKISEGQSAQGLYDEMEKITSEMLQHTELASAKNTFNLLKHEKTRNSFFTAVSSEILFEFTPSPAMLTFSPHGAQRLGVEETIFNPQENQQLLSIVSRTDILQLYRALQKTTPANPLVEYHCNCTLNGETIPMTMVCRTLWSIDEPPVCIGAIGKVTDQALPEGYAFRKEIMQ